MTDTNPRVVNRRFHRLAAFICAVPVLIVIVSGLLLQVKKERCFNETARHCWLTPMPRWGPPSYKG